MATHKLKQTDARVGKLDSSTRVSVELSGVGWWDGRKKKRSSESRKSSNREPKTAALQGAGQPIRDQEQTAQKDKLKTVKSKCDDETESEREMRKFLNRKEMWNKKYTWRKIKQEQKQTYRKGKEEK